MAPTANAAQVIGGKTTDSALEFNPSDRNEYIQPEATRLAMMKFQFEDLKVAICDEVSMVGSSKLTKINYRFQDIVDGRRKKEFMGGISFIASGKYIFFVSRFFFMNPFQVIYINFLLFRIASLQKKIIWMAELTFHLVTDMNFSRSST